MKRASAHPEEPRRRGVSKGAAIDRLHRAIALVEAEPDPELALQALRDCGAERSHYAGSVILRYCGAAGSCTSTTAGLLASWTRAARLRIARLEGRTR